MMRIDEISSEELADMAKRGILQELAETQQDLINILERKTELLESEMRIKIKLNKILR